MKKILISVSVIAAAAAVVIGATTAYFSDTETSTGNTFTAGTLDLEPKVNEIVNGSFSLTGIYPSQDLAPIMLKLTNLGNVEGWLNLNLSFAPADDTNYAGEFSGTGWNMTDEEFARLVYVEKAIHHDSVVSGGPWDVTSAWVTEGDTNADGKLSLYELMEMTNAKTLPDSLVSLTKKTISFEITFHLGDTFDGVTLSDPESANSWATYKAASPTWKIVSDGNSIWNVPQADGVKVDITAKLDQRTSW